MINISSTRSTCLTDAAPCLIEWLPVTWYASTDAVRTTAEDLYIAAAWADVIGSFLKIGLEPEMAMGLIRDGLKNCRTRDLGHPDTLTLFVSGSTRRKAGAVTIQRGGLQAAIDPDDARGMARQWLEVAVGTSQDSLTDEALEQVAKLASPERDAVFDYMLAVRRLADDPEPRARGLRRA